MSTTTWRWAPLARVESWVPSAKAMGVSKVARSRGQFLDQYRRAGGDWRRLSDWWQARRNAFVARHMAQARRNGERLYDPTTRGYSKRGLALLMWAYDPR